MKIQQQLATRLYELLPHKKELEFGCRFWIYSGDHKKKLYCYMVSYSHYALKEYRTSNHYIWEINKEQILSSGGEIIGQPLRLADLLMAIEKVLDDNHICYVNSVGAVYVLDMNKSYQKQFEDTNYGEYNLSKDNILDQSDEFCEFVLELLK